MAALDRDPIVGANAADALTDQVQARRGRLDQHFLRDVSLVDDLGDPAQDRVVEAVLQHDGVEAGMPGVVRQARAGDVERLGALRERLLSDGDEEKLGVRIDEASDQPGTADPVDADVLPGDPSHSSALPPAESSAAWTR